MDYTKTPISSADHITLLKGRGLAIADEQRAERYLETIGYYRLSGYMYHLQKRDKSHRFLPNVTFDTIVDTYKFDKKLRAVVAEYMERIEVALRAKLTNIYSLKYGFYWYNDQALFSDNAVFISINADINDKFKEEKEHFVKAFKTNHPGETRLPSPMALEVLSLGKLARLYKALATTEEKKRVSKEFGLIITLFESWVIWLANVRNICAHHSRLWNKVMTPDRPFFSRKKEYRFNDTLTEENSMTTYGAISLINRILLSFNPGNSFTSKVEALIDEYNINARHMSFPDDWKTTATWHHERKTGPLPLAEGGSPARG